MQARRHVTNRRHTNLCWPEYTTLPLVRRRGAHDTARETVAGW